MSGSRSSFVDLRPHPRRDGLSTPSPFVAVANAAFAIALLVLKDEVPLPVRLIFAVPVVFVVFATSLPLVSPISLPAALSVMLSVA